LQFSVLTVISYEVRKDGKRLSRREAAELAHDYSRAAQLAKYMIFDLEEPWHWPLCAKKISLRNEMASVKGLVEQAEAAEAKAGPKDPSPELAKADAVDRDAEVP
jgi:hypothetical protein